MSNLGQQLFLNQLNQNSQSHASHPPVPIEELLAQSHSDLIHVAATSLQPQTAQHEHGSKPTTKQQNMSLQDNYTYE